MGSGGQTVDLPPHGCAIAVGSGPAHGREALPHRDNDYFHRGARRISNNTRLPKGASIEKQAFYKLLPRPGEVCFLLLTLFLVQRVCFLCP